eukprot:NODE_1_length_95616_cov_0.657642.p33 type:complete len:320 gc:universal NODE_1_length_95616_cov_0.657642:23790-24749(+)
MESSSQHDIQSNIEDSPPNPSPILAEKTIKIPLKNVGIDTYPSQLQSKLKLRGFNFNIMVVGSSGLGKTTFINSLFNSNLVKHESHLDESGTTQIKIHNFTLTENGINMHLNLIDTPGFGLGINNENAMENILKYIKEQYTLYLRRELTAAREKFILDTRVHAILYFISPSGHSLKPLDILALKLLGDICNVIPVIAKSDALTGDERIAFKKRVQEEFQFHGIRLYPYDSDPYHIDKDKSRLEDEDLQKILEDQVTLNQKYRDLMPFAIIGSELLVPIDGKEGSKMVRGRKTYWGGVINIEDPNHCEFTQLKKFLLQYF